MSQPEGVRSLPSPAQEALALLDAWLCEPMAGDRSDVAKARDLLRAASAPPEPNPDTDAEWIAEVEGILIQHAEDRLPIRAAVKQLFGLRAAGGCADDSGVRSRPSPAGEGGLRQWEAVIEAAVRRWYVDPRDERTLPQAVLAALRVAGPLRTDTPSEREARLEAALRAIDTAYGMGYSTYTMYEIAKKALWGVRTASAPPEPEEPLLSGIEAALGRLERWELASCYPGVDHTEIRDDLRLLLPAFRAAHGALAARAARPSGGEPHD